MIHANVFGVLYCTHAALPLMREQGAGHIVNVSSVAGRVARAGSGVYNLTKFGVGAFSESLRQEGVAIGVRVTLIEPGAVATELPGHNRPEVLEQIAKRFADVSRCPPRTSPLPSSTRSASRRTSQSTRSSCAPAAQARLSACAASAPPGTCGANCSCTISSSRWRRDRPAASCGRARSARRASPPSRAARRGSRVGAHEHVRRERRESRCVISHTCRSWTSTTPAWATSASPIALRIQALGRGLEEHPPGGLHQRDARADHQRGDQQRGDRVGALEAGRRGSPRRRARCRGTRTGR